MSIENAEKMYKRCEDLREKLKKCEMKDFDRIFKALKQAKKDYNDLVTEEEHKAIIRAGELRTRGY